LAVEYDLVIIGATTAARSAAIEAVNLQARVVLVLPQSDQLHAQRDLYPFALAQIARNHRPNRSPMQQPTSYPWQYARVAIDRLEQQSAPALLATRGIETISGSGEFSLRPQLAFNLNGRSLRARRYLIATGSIAANPLISGIQSVGYLTLDQLPTLADQQIPLRWAIIGSESIGVELAQTLAKLGCQVTLIVETEQLLPYENPELANLIQAHLEADGVRIYLETTVTNVAQSDPVNPAENIVTSVIPQSGGYANEQQSKLVTIGDETITVDQIFIALPDRPLLDPVNFQGVGVDYTEKGILIDNKLQTSHRQIYACGSVCGNVLGGYHSQSLTQYEAKIAVRNALSWRKTKIDYSSYNHLPWAVYTDPPLARVGMTIDTAIDRDRADLIILKNYLKTSTQAILANKTSGYCQIVATRTGRILGAEMIGQNAPDLIQILAIAIQQKIKIPDLITFPCLSPSYTEFIYQTAREWYAYYRLRPQPKYNWLKPLQWWN
jgi:pyruvate/2-oxoglutarate dehydrogenase complex dihydrolipoamide dehydrogenase (E3) component